MPGTNAGRPKIVERTSGAERKISRIRGPFTKSGIASPSSSNSARRSVAEGSVKKFNVLPRRFTGNPMVTTPKTNPAYAPISPRTSLRLVICVFGSSVYIIIQYCILIKCPSSRGFVHQKPSSRSLFLCQIPSFSSFSPLRRFPLF